jgi:hypothetical protein
MAGGCGSSQRHRAIHLNILFIMTDDHAISHMSCEGNKILQTSNLDRIAAEGVRFATHFCTNSLCAPSQWRASTPALLPKWEITWKRSATENGKPLVRPVRLEQV